MLKLLLGEGEVGLLVSISLVGQTTKKTVMHDLCFFGGIDLAIGDRINYK